MYPVPEDLVQRATDLLVERQEVSVSLVQRHLKLGYSPALLLMSVLAERGVVTAPDPKGKRNLTSTYSKDTNQ